MQQRVFVFNMWGGKRAGAGRPRKDGAKKTGVPHLPRRLLATRLPVHVTCRMAGGVWHLRTRRCFSIMQRAMYAGAAKGGFRLVNYAVLRDQVHMIVEAADRMRV